MSPSKVLTLMAAVLAIVCVVAAGVYVYKQRRDVAGEGGKTPSIAVTPAPGEQATKPEIPPLPQAKPEAPAQAKPEAGTAAEATAPQGAKLPSFDVVLVEPSGEGVIAGRAEPGWKVEIESGGKTVAQVTADANGEWSIVLKEPLASGEHALSLSAQSPDGKQALESAKSESVAVAPAEDKKSAAASAGDSHEPTPPEASAEAVPGDKSLIAPKSPEPAAAEVPQPEAETADEIPGDKSLIAPKASETARAEASQPEPQTGEEIPGDKSLIQPQGEERHAAAEPSAGLESEGPGEVPGDRSLVEPGAPKPSSGPQAPPVKIRMVDYEDLAPGKGRMKLDGTSAPGSTVYLYFDDERLAEIIAGGDGNWAFEAEKVLPSGRHEFRAEWYDEATGVLAGRTIVAVERIKPAPEVAAKEAEPAKTPEPAASSAPAGEAAPQSKSADEIPSDKSLIEPPRKEESESLDVASKSEGEGEIPGDKSLIEPQAAPESLAMADSDALATEGEIPGDKSLIEPPSKEESGLPDVASQSEGEGEIPGDKSLIPRDEEEPTERTAAAEPAPSAATVAEESAIEPAPAPADSTGEQGEAGDRTTAEPAPSPETATTEPAGEPQPSPKAPEAKSGQKAAAAEPAPSAETAAKEPTKEPAPAPEVSKDDEKPAEKTAAAPLGPMVVRERRTEIYLIKRGDTLWDLAEQYLDGGWRYKRIYRNNRNVIRNPHWIYPDQKLVIPEP